MRAVESTFVFGLIYCLLPGGDGQGSDRNVIFKDFESIDLNADGFLTPLEYAAQFGQSDPFLLARSRIQRPGRRGLAGSKCTVRKRSACLGRDGISCLRFGSGLSNLCAKVEFLLQAGPLFAQMTKKQQLPVVNASVAAGLLKRLVASRGGRYPLALSAAESTTDLGPDRGRIHLEVRATTLARSLDAGQLERALTSALPKWRAQLLLALQLGDAEVGTTQHRVLWEGTRVNVECGAWSDGERMPAERKKVYDVNGSWVDSKGFPRYDRAKGTRLPRRGLRATPSTPPPPPPPFPCACTGDNTGVDDEAGFDADYGRFCAPWDAIEPHCLEGGEYFGEDWCARAWCYVPESCGEASMIFSNFTLYWTYTPCLSPPPPPSPRSGCCRETLDPSHTCNTEDRLWGGQANAGVNDSPDLCGWYCIDTFGYDAGFTDFWPNSFSVVGTGWCNCYRTCLEIRCVSKACYGSEGGDVTTQVVIEPSPPPIQLPFPPPATPPPLPLPPAPPFEALGPAADVCGLNASGLAITIDAEIPEHAGAQLQAALKMTEVEVVCLYVNVSLDEALPSVNRTLQVLGRCPGGVWCEVSGKDKVALFHVGAAGNLTLEDLALHAGKSEAEGGALHLAAESVAHIRNCTMQSCSSQNHGGAVYCGAGGHVTLTAVQLTENTAGFSGGAVYGAPGSHVIIMSSHVTNNSARLQGGGVNVQEGGLLEVGGGTKVSQNYGYYGGGLAMDQSSLRLSGGSAVTNNHADMDGGGIYCVKECVVTVEVSSLIGNHANESGGGLYMHTGSALELHNATVQGNVARSRNGGGFLLYELSTVLMTRSIVGLNFAQVNGAGVFLHTWTSLVADGATRVEDNSAGIDGGGIYITGGSLMVVQGQSVVAGNRAGSVGGGINSRGCARCNTSIVVTDGSSVTNNTAGGGGGGIHSMLSTIYLQNHSHVTANVARKGSGGGVLAQDGSAVLVAGGSRLSANHAPAGHGGGIGVTDGVVNMTDGCYAEGNVAGSAGGGIFAARSSVLLREGSHLQGNRAGMMYTGGIGGGGMGVSHGTVTIELGCSVVDNWSGVSGGGVHLEQARASIRGSALSGNVARLNGGALELHRSAVAHLSGVSISNNSAEGQGGGLHASVEVKLLLHGCNVTSNIALTDGGGMQARADFAPPLLVASARAVDPLLTS
ncbi:hypothetical protein CYMTET_19645 [Cymbomonas tetramitiformis]|uniref:Pectate lyase C n=1 Tax=Cymbomonas tetramitiformis TaxID=36881 RepID=A0AAE0G6W3_9CHLO|nr:hypothetical protein CYMTET_19645 [Cymbomonas tetramitiformis]